LLLRLVNTAVLEDPVVTVPVNEFELVSVAVAVYPVIEVPPLEGVGHVTVSELVVVLPEDKVSTGAPGTV
jgi:hypothetical protein